MDKSGLVLYLSQVIAVGSLWKLIKKESLTALFVKKKKPAFGL